MLNRDALEYAHSIALTRDMILSDLGELKENDTKGLDRIMNMLAELQENSLKYLDVEKENENEMYFIMNAIERNDGLYDIQGEDILVCDKRVMDNTYRRYPDLNDRLDYFQSIIDDIPEQTKKFRDDMYKQILPDNATPEEIDEYITDEEMRYYEENVIPDLTEEDRDVYEQTVEIAQQYSEKQKEPVEESMRSGSHSEIKQQLDETKDRANSLADKAEKVGAPKDVYVDPTKKDIKDVYESTEPFVDNSKNRIEDNVVQKSNDRGINAGLTGLEKIAYNIGQAIQKVQNNKKVDWAIEAEKNHRAARRAMAIQYAALNVQKQKMTARLAKQQQKDLNQAKNKFNKEQTKIELQNRKERFRELMAGADPEELRRSVRKEFNPDVVVDSVETRRLKEMISGIDKQMNQVNMNYVQSQTLSVRNLKELQEERESRFDVSNDDRRIQMMEMAREAKKDLITSAEAQTRGQNDATQFSVFKGQGLSDKSNGLQGLIDRARAAKQMKEEMKNINAEAQQKAIRQAAQTQR